MTKSPFSDDDNDAFRAVHDAFGHASTGRHFDRHGEEAAWRKHSQIYSPLARQAMTTETRGQSSTFIYAYGGKRVPGAEGDAASRGVLDAMTFDLAAYVRASTEAQGVPERLTDGDTVLAVVRLILARRSVLLSDQKPRTGRPIHPATPTSGRRAS
jgi:hypothetical protein